MDGSSDRTSPDDERDLERSVGEDGDGRKMGNSACSVDTWFYD